jgi:O-acetyl-ADP-ribose deacetylase (regulator of RNase III)
MVVGLRLKGMTMLQFVQTSIFESPAQTLVNTVNTVGVMGKGIAKEFKQKYPPMFREYKGFCDSNELTIGALHIWRSQQKWVLNFPTKTTWRLPSKIEYIEQGLKTFRQHYPILGIRSISFPPLGCGNGNLNWGEVKPLMIRYLRNLDIPIWIHEKHVAQSFQPEQEEPNAKRAPETYDEFFADLKSVAIECSGRFAHYPMHWPYQAEFNEKDRHLHIFFDREHIVDEEFINVAWIGLKLGVLTLDHFGSPANQRFAGYLMPLISRLPYVKTLNMRREQKGGTREILGLYFTDAAAGFEEYRIRALA